MRPTEAVEFVELVKQFAPQQKWSEYSTEAWELVLEDIPLTDARQALKHVASRETWIAPADILKEAKIIRRQRVESASPLAFQPTTDEPRQYIKELRSHLRAVGDGVQHDVPQLEQRFNPAELGHLFQPVPQIAPTRTLLPAVKVQPGPHARALMRAHLERSAANVPLEGEILPPKVAR